MQTFEFKGGWLLPDVTRRAIYGGGGGGTLVKKPDFSLKIS